jgi:hypothetical protein
MEHKLELATAMAAGAPLIDARRSNQQQLEFTLPREFF